MLRGTLEQVLLFVDHWSDPSAWYEGSLPLQDAIQSVFLRVILLLGSARIRRYESWWKKIRRSLGNAISEDSSSLEDAVVRLGSALQTTRAQAQARLVTPFQASLSHYTSNLVSIGQPLTRHHEQHVHTWPHSLGSIYKSIQAKGHAHVLAGDQHNNYQGANMTTINISSSPRTSGEENLLEVWMEHDASPGMELEQAIPNTCKWLLQTSQWGNWKDGGMSQPLVITGSSGSGKSSIAAFIINELQKTSVPTLYYFFDAAQRSAFCNSRSFFLSIVTQIFDRLLETGNQRPAVSILEQYRKSYRLSIQQCPETNLVQIADKLLAKISCYHLVVDGLDECEQGSVDLKGLLRKLASQPGASVLCTYRNAMTGTSNDSTFLDLDSCSEQVHKDLVLFIKHEIRATLGLTDTEDTELVEDITQSVAARCNDNFLVAKQYVGLLAGCDTRREIECRLDDPNPEHLYNEWLHFIEHKHQHDRVKFDRQRDIMKVLVAAQRPLLLDELNEFLAISGQPDVALSRNLVLASRFRQQVEDLCGRFVKISVQGKVSFFHSSARAFIATQPRTSADEANLYLARKCLLVLDLPIYQDPKTPAELLRKHLGAPMGLATKSPATFSATYNYAALYFHRHIEAVNRPPLDLLRKLNKFMLGVSFVTWSEHVRDLRPGTGFASQIEVRADLWKWWRTLSEADQDQVQIGEFFERSHIELSFELEEDRDGDKILPLLPRLRLAEFFSSAGLSLADWQKSYEQKHEVLERILQILPAKNVFVLGIRALLLQDYFWRKNFPQALEEAFELLNDQKEALGGDSDISSTTKWVIAAALIALCRYDGAGEILADAIARVRDKFGEKDRFFNTLLLMEGARLERVNDNDKAAATYEAALQTMKELTGPTSTFVLILHTALGAVFRKQQKFEKAKENLLVGWGERQIISSINVNGCLDAALQLALLHRDAGEYDDCIQVLELIRDSTVFAADFERFCQLEHIRNLVRLDKNEYLAAKQSLMALLQAAGGEDREKNNRELLWVRIDLADAMRDHQEDEEALMLFTDLVLPKDAVVVQDEDYVLMEPREELEAAEQALRLVRNAEFDKAQQVLNNAKLQWKREADFWFIIQGGPTLDTAVIAPIKKFSPSVGND